MVNHGERVFNNDLFEVLNETPFYGTTLWPPPLEPRILLAQALARQSKFALCRNF